MEAAAHTKGGFGGVPQKVGKEFVKADKMKKGGVAQSFKKAGFYEEGKSKPERLSIVNRATTKPQRVQIVEKLFSSKKMKEGGLYANIHAKQERIAKGSDEHMRKPGSKGAPTAGAFRDSAKTAKPKKMADGGIAGLGGMIANGPSTPPVPAAGLKSSFTGNGSTGGGGSSLAAGLDAVSSGAQNANAALDRVKNDLGSGGSVSDASSPIAAKKGGHITTRRTSTGSRSTKSPSW
jgi:hypothetical protein